MVFLTFSHKCWEWKRSFQTWNRSGVWEAPSICFGCPKNWDVETGLVLLHRTRNILKRIEDGNERK